MSGKAFFRDRDAFLMQVALDATLPAMAVRVAVLLASYVNSVTGYAWPSMGTLAARLGIGENTVRRGLRSLQLAGHIAIDMGGGRGAVNRYRWVLRGAAKDGDRAADDTPATVEEVVKPHTDWDPLKKEALPIEAHKPPPDWDPNYLKEQPEKEGKNPPAPIGDQSEVPARNRRAPDPVIGSQIVIARPDRFLEFWGAFPRRVAEADARKAFAIATRRGVNPEVIIAGARRYAVERAGQEERFTAHPANWLRGERWSDPPVKPSVASSNPEGAAQPGSGRRQPTATDIAMAHVARTRRNEAQ